MSQKSNYIFISTRHEHANYYIRKPTDRQTKPPTNIEYPTWHTSYPCIIQSWASRRFTLKSMRLSDRQTDNAYLKIALLPAMKILPGPLVRTLLHHTVMGRSQVHVEICVGGFQVTHVCSFTIKLYTLLQIYNY